MDVYFIFKCWIFGINVVKEYLVIDLFYDFKLMFELIFKNNVVIYLILF